MDITSIQKGLAKAVKHNPQAFELIFKFLRKTYNQQGLIGDTQEETVTRVYRRDGKLEALRELERYILTNNPYI